MDLTQRVSVVEGKINALLEMLGNRPELATDAVKIKDFIEKYSVVNTLLASDTIESLLTKVDELNKSIQEVQKELQVPLTVAKEQSAKIMKFYSDDSAQLALNIVDLKLFKSSSYKSLRDVIDYINSFEIDKKMKNLDAQLAIVKDISNKIIQQKDKINSILKRIDTQEELINQIRETNKEQDAQIDYVNNLIVEIEKQIENYAFFADEFNKIYLNAKEFISTFGELKEKLEYIYNRDNIIQKLLEDIIGFMGNDFATINKTIKGLKDSIDSFSKEMLDWLNYSLMFVNEVKAYNLSLGAYNKEMDNIINRCREIKKTITSISL